MPRSYSAVFVALACIALSVSSARAQSVQLLQGRGSVTVQNGLPARIAALLVAYGEHGAEDYVTAVVEARGVTTLRTRNQHPYVLARIEPLHPRVGAMGTAELGCDTRQAARTLPIRADSLRVALERLKIEGTPEAEQELSVASELAQVELQQHLDELQLQSFMYRSLRETDTSSDWQDTQRRNREDGEEQRDQIISQLAYAASAYDEVLQARLSILTRQADEMQRVAEQADSANKLIDGMVRGAKLESEGGRALDDVVRRELSSALPSGFATLDDVSEVTRVCGSAGLVSDWLLVRGSAEPGRSLGFALAEYDNGDHGLVPLRRIASTQDWVIHVYWPPEAHRLTLKFTDGRGRTTARRVELGRPSLRESAEVARKRLDDVKKKYKNARYRAEGADQLKTIIVP